MSKKRIFDPIIQPRNGSDFEILDMMKYRVEYLKEKRERGELPPLPKETLFGRIHAYWPNIKINASTGLYGSLFLLVIILLSPIVVPVAIILLVKEEIYEKRIVSGKVVRTWKKALSLNHFPETPICLPDIQKVKFGTYCVRAVWQASRNEITSLIKSERYRQDIFELSEAILKDNQIGSNTQDHKSKIKLEEKEKLLLSLYTIRFLVHDRQSPSRDRIDLCLRSNEISIDEFVEMVELYFDSFSMTGGEYGTRSMCELFTFVLIRNGQIDLAALNLARLGKIPGSQRYLEDSEGQLVSFRSHLANFRKSKDGCLKLAKKIISSRRRLLCLPLVMSDRLFLYFVGPNGTKCHDFNGCGLEYKKINDLLRRTHGLFSVAPLAKAQPSRVNDDSDFISTDFFHSFLHHRFSHEIEEDAFRLTDESMSNLLIEISNQICDPIASAEFELCEAPSTGFVDLTPGDPLSFLPIDTAQIFAIENGHPEKLPISMNFSRLKLPQIASSNNKIDAKILLIGDPSYSLDHSDLEIELVSDAFAPKNVVRMELSDALQFSKGNKLLPEVDILHFIGHHQFSYLHGVKNVIPSFDGNVNEGEFLQIFSKFRSKLNFLSACSTNSTFFTDPAARNTALSSKVLKQYPCNVISTLWPIPDEAAAYFAQQFYQNLSIYRGNFGIALWVTKRSFARDEVKFEPSHINSEVRLGGPSTTENAGMKSPWCWGAYTLN